MSLLLPSIKCASNIKMLALNAVKKTLSDTLNGLAGPGKGKAKLGELIAKGNAVKAQLLVMVPQLPLFPPPLPNFKAEFSAMLANISNQVAFAAAAAALEKKWGKAIGLTLIKNLIAGAATIDLCKDIPNIDGKLQSDGTMQAIRKAQDSPMPGAIPVLAIRLTPTVQSATTQPTSGISAVILNDYSKYLDIKCETVPKVIAPILKTGQNHAKLLDAAYKKSDWTNLLKKIAADGSGNLKEYRKTNRLTQAEIAIINELMLHKSIIGEYNTLIDIIRCYFAYYEQLICNLKTQEQFDQWLVSPDVVAGLTVTTVTNFGSAATAAEYTKTDDTNTGKTAIAQIKSLMDPHKESIRNGAAYYANRAKK